MPVAFAPAYLRCNTRSKETPDKILYSGGLRFRKHTSVVPSHGLKRREQQGNSAVRYNILFLYCAAPVYGLYIIFIII